MMYHFVLKDKDDNIFWLTTMPIYSLINNSSSCDTYLIDIASRISEPTTHALSEQQKYRKAFEI